MAYDALYEDVYSVGYADQTVYDEEVAVGANWMTCEFPTINVEREVFAVRRASSQAMTSSKRGIGARKGTLTFRQLMRSQAVGFDASVGNPTTTAPELDLFAEIMGASAVGAYGVGGGGGGFSAPQLAANQIDVGAVLKLGCAYAYGATPSAIKAIAWIESLDSLTLFQLFQDVRALGANNDNVYPLLTMIPSLTVDPTPKTFRLVGAHTGQDIRVIGAMPTEVMLELDPAGQFYASYTYDFTDINEAGASGGLQTATAYQTIPPLLGVHNARVVLGANLGEETFADYDDGTADPDGTCDVGSLRIKIGIAYSPIKCHGGAQGRTAMKVRNKTCEATFTVPKVAEMERTDGRNAFVASLEDQTPVSASVEVGTQSGALFAALLPACTVSAEPGRGLVDGKYSYTITMETDEYAGDGAWTDAGNTAARFAVG